MALCSLIELMCHSETTHSLDCSRLLKLANCVVTESQLPVGTTLLQLPVVNADQLYPVIEAMEPVCPINIFTESEVPAVTTDQLDPVVEATVVSQGPVSMPSKRQHSPAEITFIGPFEISPPPKQRHDTRKRESGRSTKTAILTSSPYKEKLVKKWKIRGP